LGDRFQSDLLKFVGTNSTRHYWCGAFLTTSDYRGEREANGLLAVALWEQGLLLESKKGKDERHVRPLHHLLAIQYARLGFRTLAGHHKACAEYCRTELGEGGPATSLEDSKVYDSVEPLPLAIGRQPPPESRQVDPP